MSKNHAFRTAHAVPGASLPSVEPIGGPSASLAFDNSSRSASSRVLVDGAERSVRLPGHDGEPVGGTRDERLHGSRRHGGNITTDPIAHPT